MAVIIPIAQSVYFQTFTTTLDSVQYNFRVRWNSKDAAWYFDVAEADNTPIATGVKIVLGCYLGRTTNHTLFRDGVFVAVDTAPGLAGEAKDAGIDDLGARVLLMRLELVEVLSLRVTSTFPDTTEIAAAAAS